MTDDNMLEGRKDDKAKPDFTLLPMGAIGEVVKVLDYGAVKYDRDNWKHVATPRRRYLAAAFRHLAALSDGEYHDSESGLPHAAHAIASLLFLLWFGEED